MEQNKLKKGTELYLAEIVKSTEELRKTMKDRMDEQNEYLRKIERTSRIFFYLIVFQLILFHLFTMFGGR